MMPVSILIVLGSSLFAYDTTNSRIHKEELVILSLFKLLLTPLIGVVIIWIFTKMGIIKDVVLALVSIITFSTPPGINVLVIASRYGDNSADVAKILVF